MVDQDQLQIMTNQYYDKVKEFDQRWEEYDRRSTTGMPGERDWQKEVEMEDNMRLVADMQIALQREIRCVCVCVCVKVWSSFCTITLLHSHILSLSSSISLSPI